MSSGIDKSWIRLDYNDARYPQGVNRFIRSGEDNNTLDTLLEGGEGVGVELEQDNAEDVPTYFDENLKEALSDLYSGCQNFTVLRFVLRMFRVKVKHGLTDSGFTEMLQLLRSAFPSGNKTPKNTYQAEKLVKELGLKYNKINVCPNDCIIYWKEKEGLENCTTCKLSRYKPRTIEDWKNRARQPAKQLRYFPITDRLKRMYSVKWVAREMCWHSMNQSREGELVYPVDSSSWKIIDHKYKDFSLEPRNVRLGLATDGFNPFGMQNATYSCWPVMCVTYNLPPWLCMKCQFTMLALLIDGPRQLGKDINVFLRPLVDELNALWKPGVLVKDANTGGMFNMRALLLWTIHDFPAYGDVSGCRTKGRYACPPCGPNTSTIILIHGKKNVYPDTRHFLAMEDPMRIYVKKSYFNKKREHREQPTRLSGSQVKEITKSLKVKWGKMKSMDYEDGDDCSDSYFHKQSIFFELEYWEFLPVRHNLDVMHIEKNVCKIVIALMLNTINKTKDDINARKDLKHLGIKRKYWLNDEEKGERGHLCLRPEEKKLFLTTLRDICVPVGFSSNWRNVVQGVPLDLKGMKSHDYHILRLMKEYKGLVMNKSHPEGCIAKRFLKEETMIFCEGYKEGGVYFKN